MYNNIILLVKCIYSARYSFLTKGCPDLNEVGLLQYTDSKSPTKMTSISGVELSEYPPFSNVCVNESDPP